jgi:predicted RNA polymerase sigma factor
LGQIYELKGDRPSAVSEYRAVLALEPNDKDRAFIEKRLQELADGLTQ